MEFIRRLVWKPARRIAGLLFVVVVVPVLGGYFTDIAEQKQVYEHPKQSGAAIITWLSHIAVNHTFQLVAVGLGCFVAGAWLDSIFGERSAKVLPIEIKFDRGNPEGQYWYDRQVPTDNDYEDHDETIYRVRVKNLTGKTIHGLEATLIYKNGGSERLNFHIAASQVCDLHPQATDFITFYRHDAVEEMLWENEPEYSAKRNYDLRLTAPDLVTCFASIEVDVSGNLPVILLNTKSERPS